MANANLPDDFDVVERTPSVEAPPVSVAVRLPLDSAMPDRSDGFQVVAIIHSLQRVLALRMRDDAGRDRAVLAGNERSRVDDHVRPGRANSQTTNMNRSGAIF